MPYTTKSSQVVPPPAPGQKAPISPTPPRRDAARPPASEVQKREEDRDEVLRESFPASDPPPVSPAPVSDDRAPRHSPLPPSSAPNAPPHTRFSAARRSSRPPARLTFNTRSPPAHRWQCEMRATRSSDGGGSLVTQGTRLGSPGNSKRPYGTGSRVTSPFGWDSMLARVLPLTGNHDRARLKPAHARGGCRAAACAGP